GDQGVGGRVELVIGRFGQGVGALETGEVAVVIDHLAQVDAQVPGRGFRLAAADEDVVRGGRIVIRIDRAFAGIGAAIPVHGRIRADLRQQRGAGLHRTFTDGEAGGFGTGE